MEDAHRGGSLVRSKNGYGGSAYSMLMHMISIRLHSFMLNMRMQLMLTDMLFPLMLLAHVTGKSPLESVIWGLPFSYIYTHILIGSPLVSVILLLTLSCIYTHIWSRSPRESAISGALFDALRSHFLEPIPLAMPAFAVCFCAQSRLNRGHENWLKIRSKRAHSMEPWLNTMYS